VARVGPRRGQISPVCFGGANPLPYRTFPADLVTTKGSLVEPCPFSSLSWGEGRGPPLQGAVSSGLQELSLTRAFREAERKGCVEIQRGFVPNRDILASK